LISFFKQIQRITNAKEAEEFLFTNLSSHINHKLISKCIAFVTKAHDGQFRKSGEPYVTHPILVACTVNFVGGDEDMIIAALLHDVVEDTTYSLDDVQKQYSDSIAKLVDGLTKITDIKDDFKITSKKSDATLIKAALSFRKMLIASIEDVRILVIKLCDRVHNMLTLDALTPTKQIKIAEETLVVFAPIAHRLGISILKNILEDKSFYYILRDEYIKIDQYLIDNQYQLDNKLNEFIEKLKVKLYKNGLSESDFEIKARVKHHYSIYLKMQRKGVNIEEVLDLLAIRVLLKDENSCYCTLGIIHQNFRPLIARFKDYIAIPKENGYQTLHTTVFDSSNIYEIQIRTLKMHDNAEYGLAAHWKYKSNSTNFDNNVKWLKSLEYSSSDVTEFYELAKNDLYSDDIIVTSPKGTNFTLPREALALDFAYAIHSDVGNYAKEAYINGESKSLLTILKNGDNVLIKTNEEMSLRCSWVNTVKTSKAKSNIKIYCKNRIREINYMVNTNILSNLFEKDIAFVQQFISKDTKFCEKLSQDIFIFEDLKELKDKLRTHLVDNGSFFNRLKLSFTKLSSNKIDNLLIYSSSTINDVGYDYCCHPKFGDEIISFKEGKKIIVHHKLCENAKKMMQNHKKIVFVEWNNNLRRSYYLIVSLENRIGSLGEFLEYLAKNSISIVMLQIGNARSDYVDYCEMKIDTNINSINKVKTLLSKKSKVIELYESKDAYK